MEPVEGYGRPGMMAWLSDFFRSDNTGGVFYGWWLVVIGSLIILVGREMGAATSVAASRDWGYDHVGVEPPWNVAFIAGGAIGWLLSLYLAGRGADRFGPRRMIQIGLPLAGAIVLLQAVRAPGMVQAVYTLMTAVALIGAYIPTITALNHWFRERLALAIGLMLFGVAVGRVVLDGLLALLVIIVGWQPVTVGSGAVIVLAAFPLAWGIRNGPEDRGEYPDGSALVPAERIPDYGWRETMRSGQFWMLMAASVCASGASSIATFYDWQIISQGSATFETIEKLGSYEKYATAAGILLGGLATYWLRVRYVLAGTAVIQTVGMALLLAGYGPVILQSGILVGAASGMSAAPGIAAVGVYFGRRSFGAITVTSTFIGHFASTVLLPGAGYLGSVTGGYVWVFVAAGIVSVVGAGLYLMMGEPRLATAQMVEEPAVS